MVPFMTAVQCSLDIVLVSDSCVWAISFGSGNLNKSSINESKAGSGSTPTFFADALLIPMDVSEN